MQIRLDVYETEGCFDYFLGHVMEQVAEWGAGQIAHKLPKENQRKASPDTRLWLHVQNQYKGIYHLL